MIRKISLLIAGIILGAGAVISLTQTQLFTGYAAKAAALDTYRQLNLFGDVFEKVRTDYVEAPEDAELVESAINGMLTSLDPHSAYLNPKSFSDMQVQTRGEFGGLGIEVTMEEGLVKVVSPIDDTPAHKAGILANDLITHIDGEAVLGMALNEAVELMRGPVNSEIEITVWREGLEEPIEIKITRAIITIQPVRHRVEDDIGYIRITQFNQHTSGGLNKAIRELKTKIPEEELKGYILDLRNNPGGLLDQAVEVSDAFLERGEIVSTRSRRPEDTLRFSANSGDLTDGQPIIVLVNGGSASASEIVAGALQDHQRATVLGSRSFGKGSVQTIVPLGSNGAIRLTTARYYTPSGRSIQAKGIEPDIELLQELPEELKGRVTTRGESGLRGHLDENTGEGDSGEEVSQEEEKESGSGSQVYVPLEQENDKQLNFAYALLRGTEVNEAFPPDPAGGILPDQEESESDAN